MSSQPLRLLDREDMIQLTHLHCDVQCKFNFTYVLYSPDDCMLTVQQARNAWREVAARVAARWQHRQHKPARQPCREKHPRAPWDHNPRILGLWPAQNPMQISPQIIAGQCPARAPYLTHAGDLIWDCISSWFGRISYAHNYEFHYYFTENYNIKSIFHTTHRIKVSDNIHTIHSFNLKRETFDFAFITRQLWNLGYKVTNILQL